MIMQKKLRLIWALPLAAIVAVCVGGRTAEAGVNFSVNSSITPGSGYTTTAGDNTLMNVTFASLATTNFTLNNVGDTQALTLATVTFMEPSGDPAPDNDDGISTTEAGLGSGLNVNLTVNIVTPGGAPMITLSGTAKAGSTGYDAEGWYQLAFSPAYTSSTFTFGGASYQLHVAEQTLLFKSETIGANNPQYVTGSIELTGLNPLPSPTVPEPASLIVWSVVAGIFGVGGLRRRRNQAVA